MVGVTSVASLAVADRGMFYHLALSIDATRPSTWVKALLIDTGQVEGTMRVSGTLWSTNVIWVAKVVR